MHVEEEQGRTRQRGLTDADSMEVNQVGQFLALCHIPLLPLVDPHTDEVRVHNLCANRAQHFTGPILHDSQLPCVKHHAYLSKRSHTNRDIH